MENLRHEEGYSNQIGMGEQNPQMQMMQQPMGTMPSYYGDTEPSMLSTLVTSDPIVCSQCGSSIDIQQIQMDDGEYKICFKCQNDHVVEDQSLYEYMKTQPKENKEITSCKDHNGEKYVSYCTKCQKNLCFECVLDDEHKGEQGVLINFPEVFPARKEMKAFIAQKAKELEDLEGARQRVMEWFEKIKERMDKLFLSQQALIEFQKAFVEHFTIRRLNYIKIKSLNYLMNQLKYNKETPNLSEKTFEQNFKPLEKNLFDIIGLENIPAADDQKDSDDKGGKLKSKGKSDDSDEDEDPIKKNMKSNKPYKRTTLTQDKSEKGRVSFNKPKVIEYDKHKPIQPGDDDEDEDENTFTVKGIGSKVIKKDNDLKNLIDFFPKKPKELKKIYSASAEEG